MIFSLLWTAEFEVTNIIKDIAINAKNVGDTRLIDPTKPIHKVGIQTGTTGSHRK